MSNEADPHHRYERSNDVARRRRQCRGPPACQGAGTRSHWRLRGGQQFVGGSGTAEKEGPMKPSNPATHARALLLTVAAASLVAATGVFWTGAALAARNASRAGTPGVPYANMPAIAPIG